MKKSLLLVMLLSVPAVSVAKKATRSVETEKGAFCSNTIQLMVDKLCDIQSKVDGLEGGGGGQDCCSILATTPFLTFDDKAQTCVPLSFQGNEAQNIQQYFQFQLNEYNWDGSNPLLTRSTTTLLLNEILSNLECTLGCEQGDLGRVE